MDVGKRRKIFEASRVQNMNQHYEVEDLAAVDVDDAVCVE